MTLCNLAENDEIMETWDRCGTIMDLYAAYLTKNSSSFIGAQNAFSWGCTDGENWKIPAVCFSLRSNVSIIFQNTAAHILLPEILKDGSILPAQIAQSHKLCNAKLLVPSGDLQAAVYPFLDRHDTASNSFLTPTSKSIRVFISR